MPNEKKSWSGFAVGPLWQPGYRGVVRVEVALDEPPTADAGTIAKLHACARDLQAVDGYILRHVESAYVHGEPAPRACPESGIVEDVQSTAEFTRTTERRWAPTTEIADELSDAEEREEASR